MIRRAHSRWLVVTSLLVVAMSTVVVAPAGASLDLPIDFGSQLVGSTSAPLTAVLPLTSTVGDLRTVVVDAVNATTFQDYTIPVVEITITGAQIKQALLDTIGNLSDSTDLAVKIASVDVDGPDFAVGGDCIGADGASQPSCTASATFTPTAPGLRTAAMTVTGNVTEGLSEIEAALATAVGNDFGYLGSIAALLIPILGAMASGMVQDAVLDALNPVADLSGVGVDSVGFAGNPMIVEGDSGSSVVQVPVQLLAPSADPITVDFATSDGTATVGGHDYVETHGTQVLLPGETVGAIGVRIKGDTRLEPNETFDVTLSSPDGAVLGTSVATVTILNDELPKLRVQGSSVPEGAPASYSIRLSQPYAYGLTVHYHTNDGTATAADGDYVPVEDATLAFDGGQQGPIVVSIPTLVDSVAEPTAETFSATFSGGLAPVTRASRIKANAT
jgi:Calx-beta domain